MAQGLDGIQMRGINDLALNYSKQQLAHLVQIGQLDPAKAMLAGMAIDRVQTNAQKPPTATVFDDVLGQQAQQPQDMSGIASMAPQQGQQPQPQQMPQEGAGVSALPSGIEGMADGGIVGYADRGLVEEKPQGYYGLPFGGTSGSPEFWDKPTMPYGEQMRNVGKSLVTGLRRLLSDPALEAEDRAKLKKELAEAQAKEAAASTLPPIDAPVTTPPAGAKDATQMRILMQERNKIVMALDSEADPINKVRLQKDLEAIDREIIGASKQSVVRADTFPDSAGAKAKPTTDTTLNPFAAREAGAVSTAGSSALPALSDPRYKVDVPVETATLPKVRSVKEISAEKTEAERDAGVDTEVYSKMVDSIGKKREDLAGRKGEAIGEAIMMAGLKLMGARKGQEFKALSEGAQEGLKQYAASMKEVKAAQDKYDERMDAYRLAENEAKRTGVTSAFTTVEKEKDRLQAAEAENRKAKNRASELGATLGAGLKEADIRAFATLFGAQARAEDKMSYQDAMKIAQKSLEAKGKRYTTEQLRIATNEVLAAQGNVSVAPSKEVYDVEAGKLFGVNPTR